MTEKCFCHLNGYEVKDSSARSDIKTANNKINTIENTLPTKADKTYVDNAIKNIDIPEATAKGYYYMELPLGNIGIKENEYEYNELASSTFTKFDEFLNAISDVKQPKLVIANTTDSITNLDGTVIENPIPRYVELGNLTKTVIEGKTIYNMFGVCNSLRTYEDNYDFIADLLINGTESDSGYTIEHVFLNIKKIYLPTKEYINEVVNKNPIYFIDLSEVEFKTFGSSYNLQLPTEAKTLFENLINNEIGKTLSNDVYVNGLFVFKFKNIAMALSQGLYYQIGQASFSVYLRTITTIINKNGIDSGGYSDYVNSMHIDLTYNSDLRKITINKFSLTLQDYVQGINKVYINNNVLTKTNTNSYTPTGNYNPATKKYVDDKVASIETGGSVDLTNYYNKSETDNLLNNKANTTHTHTKSEITDFPSIPTKTSELTNDSGFLTTHQDISGKVDKTTYNAKVSEIDNSISSLETNMSTKVNTSTYNTKMSTIDDSISTINTSITSINSSITSLNSKSHQVLSGTTDPSNDEGSTGDIYIKYEG